ncbi:MAG: type II secretion system major pseudopilin GspG [Thermodesulfobacteriota bacterium]
MMLRTKNCSRGFTFLELLVTLFILGFIGSLIGPKIFGNFGRAQQQTAKTQIKMLMDGLASFKKDMGRYPSQQEGLAALVVEPSGGGKSWKGPYLKKAVPYDPWGNAYFYQNPGEHGEVDIYSFGKDNKPGGDNEDSDIRSWE